MIANVDYKIKMDFEISSLSEPVGSFIIVLFLSGMMASVRYIKRKKPETEHLGNLIEWFAFILIPVQIGIGSVYASKISPLWIYLIFVIGGSLFVGIGVRNAYHHKDGWSKNYTPWFGFFIAVIFCLGIVFTLSIWGKPPETLFPKSLS